ncbi:MAG: hypothetical protein ACOY40_19085 [Bacillota bacterium]
MFRFGLNKEEREMLNRTIKELQELRAELSVFKDTLAGMRQEDRSPAAGQAAGAEGPQDPEREETGAAGGDYAAVQYGECPFLPEDRVEAGEEGDGAGKAVEEEIPVHPAEEEQIVPADIAEEEKPRPPVAANKDWAVVNLAGRKRPWWKLWESKSRVVKRSV